MRVAVAPVSDLGERSLDVVVERRAVLDVNLVSVGVRVCSARVADFSSAGDDERPNACSVLEGDHAVDGAGEDPRVGRASRDGPVKKLGRLGEVGAESERGLTWWCSRRKSGR